MGFADGGGVVMRNEKDYVVVECPLLHEIFDIEFGIAPVAEGAAAKQEHGIDLAFSEKVGGVVRTFQIGALTVEDGDPFGVLEFVIFDEPVPAFFKDGVDGDCYCE